MTVVALVGDLIETDSNLMCGHGTYRKDSCIYATLCGTVERLNQLICVNPFHAKYTPFIGDVVIARVLEIHSSSKRWKLSANSRNDCNLLLSSILLPGGLQRRKTEDDECLMRNLFAEGDLLCAEVQAIHQDGSIGLHTRSNKYGKLGFGYLIEVSSYLIKRASSHYFELYSPSTKIHLKIIIAVNGFIWIGCMDQNTMSPNALIYYDMFFMIIRKVKDMIQNNLVMNLDNIISDSDLFCLPN